MMHDAWTRRTHRAGIGDVAPLPAAIIMALLMSGISACESTSAQQCPEGQSRVNGVCVTADGDSPELAEESSPDVLEDLDTQDGLDTDQAVVETSELTSRCIVSDDCPLGSFCGALQQCYHECASDDDCTDASTFCNANGECVTLRMADTDAEVQTCSIPQSGQCPTGFRCDTDGGLCIEGCDGRADCRIGLTCYAGVCSTPVADGDDDGARDDEAVSDKDSGSDIDQGPACSADDTCALGSYCGGSGHCVTDCVADGGCGQGRRCDAIRGRCYTPASDLEESDVEQELCTLDEDCPLRAYCAGATCQVGCINNDECATAGYVCSDHGRCVLSGADQDSDLDGGASACSIDTNCAAQYFCDAVLKVCMAGCVEDRSCPDTYYCNDHGRCRPVGSDDMLCIVDTDCPIGDYCGGQNLCTHDCVQTTDCIQSGAICTNRGRCTTSSGDQDSYEIPLACSADTQCPDDMFCYITLSQCMKVCGGSLGACPDGYTCTSRGKCVTSGR